jgi:hypothetical protein
MCSAALYMLYRRGNALLWFGIRGHYKSTLCSYAYMDMHLLQIMFAVVKLILLLRILNHFSLSFLKYSSSADISV